MKLRFSFFAIGSLLVLAGVFLPRDWYDALPRNLELPLPPIKGITLLQVSFMAQGIILMVFSALNWRCTPLPKTQLLKPTPENRPVREILSQRWALVMLGAITLLALTLRLVNLDSDLWLDEISTLVVYGPMSLFEVIGGYINFNNHLMNTLLVKLSVGLFGEHEWAVRLPVALFGTATIPVVYWIARQFRLSREVSLGIALLLTVSYHHIFFSQNARGYIGHVLLTLVASGVLVRALQTGRPRLWLLYVAAMLLNFATLLTSAYVLAAHGIVGLAALGVLYRQGAVPWHLFRRLAVVFGAIGLLAFQLYALILPHAWVQAQAKYTSEGGYFNLFSANLLSEIIRSLAAGIGLGSGPLTWVALLLGVVVAAIGFVALLRRHWSLTLALSLPVALSILFIIINGLTFSPRFLLPALPLGIVAVVQGVYTIGEIISGHLSGSLRPWVPRLATAGLVALVVAVSAGSLQYYYSTPKQAYRASIEYIESERNGDELVIVVDLAEQGYRYYSSQLGANQESYRYVRSVEELDRVISTSNQETILVTTLPRFLRLRKPELDSRIQEGWEMDRSFPGTIGNGQISVWTSNSP